MLDWKDLDDKGGDNDISVAYALGYCLRVVKRGDGHGYNFSALSVYGEEFIGFAHDKDASQMQAEGWLKQKAKGYIS